LSYTATHGAGANYANAVHLKIKIVLP